MDTRFGIVLLAGGLATGCPGDDGVGQSTGDGGSTGTLPPTGSPTTPATSMSGTSTTSPTTTGATTDPGPTTSPVTSGVQTGGSSSGVRSESSDTGEEPSAECEAGCQVEVDCGFCGTRWESVAACVQWCESNLIEAQKHSLFCRDAWEGVHACVGTLACDDFTAWCDKDPPFDYPCFENDEELSFDCSGQ